MKQPDAILKDSERAIALYEREDQGRFGEDGLDLDTAVKIIKILRKELVKALEPKTPVDDNIVAFATPQEFGLVAKPHFVDSSPIPDLFAVGTAHPLSTLERLGIPYVLPQGQMLAKEEYPELYETLTKIGYAFDQESEFKLPDFRGSVVRTNGPE